MTALDGVNGSVCNAQQYFQSLQSHNSPSPTISCLTHGQCIGLVMTAEASILGCVCVTVIFIWIGRNVHWYKKMFPNGNWKLFQGPFDIYMFSLFVFDLLQAIGGILSIRWAHNGIVTTGPYCTAQGIIAQIGQTGVALITLLLALHTFVAAVLQVGLKARGVALGLVCLACLVILLWVAIGANIHENYETPTPYWCWISPQFPRDRLGGETIWMWIALFASAVLYIPLYFWAEGFWSVDDGYSFHWKKADQRVGYAQRRATLGMLLYPLAYSLGIIPLTVARNVEFHHHKLPSAVTFLVVSIFYLSGAINVTLFLVVRPRLLLFPRPGLLDEREIQVIQPTPEEDTGGAISSDAEKFQGSPESTACSAALGNGDSKKDSATLSPVNSTRKSDHI